MAIFIAAVGPFVCTDAVDIPHLAKELGLERYYTAKFVGIIKQDPGYFPYTLIAPPFILYRDKAIFKGYCRQFKKMFSFLQSHVYQLAFYGKDGTTRIPLDKLEFVPEPSNIMETNYFKFIHMKRRVVFGVDRTIYPDIRDPDGTPAEIIYPKYSGEHMFNMVMRVYMHRNLPKEKKLGLSDEARDMLAALEEISK